MRIPDDLILSRRDLKQLSKEADERKEFLSLVRIFDKYEKTHTELESIKLNWGEQFCRENITIGCITDIHYLKEDDKPIPGTQIHRSKFL